MALFRFSKQYFDTIKNLSLEDLEQIYDIEVSSRHSLYELAKAVDNDFIQAVSLDDGVLNSRISKYKVKDTLTTRYYFCYPTDILGEEFYQYIDVIKNSNNLFVISDIGVERLKDIGYCETLKKPLCTVRDILFKSKCPDGDMGFMYEDDVFS